MHVSEEQFVDCELDRGQVTPQRLDFRQRQGVNGEVEPATQIAAGALDDLDGDALRANEVRAPPGVGLRTVHTACVGAAAHQGNVVQPAIVQATQLVGDMEWRGEHGRDHDETERLPVAFLPCREVVSEISNAALGLTQTGRGVNGADLVDRRRVLCTNGRHLQDERKREQYRQQ